MPGSYHPIYNFNLSITGPTDRFKATRNQRNSIMNRLSVRCKHKCLSDLETKYLGGREHLLPAGYKTIRENMISILSAHWDSWEGAISEIAMLELEGPKGFKIRGGDILDKDLLVLKNTILSTEKTNPVHTFKRMKAVFVTHLPPQLPTTVGASFPTEIFMELWWQELLQYWHQNFLGVMTKALSEKFQHKLLLGKGFHNFTNCEIHDEALQILSKGEKYVPHQITTLQQNKDQFTDYTWKLTVWAARNLDKKNIPIREGAAKLVETLSMLAAEATPTSKPFYQSVREDFQKFLDQIQTDTISTECGTVGEPFEAGSDIAKKLRPEGTIFATADKHFGLVLLPINAILEAEAKMMSSMGASLINKTGQQILDQINQKEHQLRCFAGDAMATLLRKFPPIPGIKQQVPFLKMNPKIHKLSLAELQGKAIDKLTFRPVADSKFYATRPCSQALASLLIDLKSKLVETFPRLQTFYPLSGYDVAKDMRDTAFPNHKPFSLIISCDLSDAYSNCSLSDLICASRFLSSLVGGNVQKQELIESLANFALTHNYIESGLKIYHYKPILPMGSCLSGDALDIIAMAGEIPTIINPPIGSLSLGLKPDQVLTIRENLNLTSYNRYRDDTKILINGDSPMEIVHGMRILGTQIFPPNIPISFEYNTFYLSFLDCCFFCNFSGRGFSTFPRLNFTRPSITLHTTSNTPPKQLVATHVGNAIRYSRLCSDERVLRHIMVLLEDELRLAGHSTANIRRCTQLGWDGIAANRKKDVDSFKHPYYDGLDGIQPSMEINYTPALTYDSHTNVTKLVKQMLFNAGKCSKLQLYGPPLSPLCSLQKILVSKPGYRHIVEPFVLDEK